MPSTGRSLATIVAMLVALAISAVLGVTRLGSVDAATGPVPGVAIQRLGASWQYATGYDRYSYLIVGRGSASSAAAQPGTSLVYHSGTSVNAGWDSGVPYSVASANGWLLRDASGNLLRNVNYPDNYIGDVGNGAYQADWARRVGDYLASVGADGVYIDDVIADITTMTGGAVPAKYPSQAAWENAMVSFIASVGSTLKARGFYVLLNAHKWLAGVAGSDDGSLEAQWWQRLAPSVSGLMNEHFVQNPTNPSQLRAAGGEWFNQWAGWQGLIGVAQNAGVDFFGLTYAMPTNTRALRYAKGSFLLEWDGGGGALVINPSADASTPGDADPWSAEWTADIGQPLGAKFQVGVGWRRNFSAGTVVVNPSPSASQTFSLGATYLMPDGTPVTSVTLSATTALILRATTTGAPVSTALPAISGSAQQGVLLASTTGTWSGTPTSYAYQWNRCDSAGGACAAISGETTAQHLLTSADLGKTIRVKVTAANASGSASATSNATGMVVASAPANLTLPAISGTAQPGQTLTSSSGTWTNSPTSYAYQWQRCDTGGNACVAVAGATATTFALTSTDVGRTLRAVVTATNSGGSATATSPASAVVGASGTQTLPASIALPTLSGTAQQGQTLAASAGTWSGSPTSYAYQWRRCDQAGGACGSVAGATSSSYALGSADLGHTVRVVVTASNAIGSASATSAASAVVAPASSVLPPANTTPPSISGTAQQGQTLSASTGSWSNTPTSYSYQWRRCDTGGAACVDVSGANGPQFALTSADVGKTLRVAVTASNAGGSASSTSAATAVVSPPPAPPAPVAPVTNTGAPNVTGPEHVGRSLETTTGSWSGNPTSFAYQWLRCSSEAVESCVPIAGATGSSYTLASADVGSYVVVRVTASNGASSASAVSRFGRPLR